MRPRSAAPKAENKRSGCLPMRGVPRRRTVAHSVTTLQSLCASTPAWWIFAGASGGRAQHTHTSPHPLFHPLPSEETACRFCAAALPDWKGVLTPQETELAGGMPYVAPTMSVTFNGEVRDGRKERERGRVTSRARVRPCPLSQPHVPFPSLFLLHFRSTTSSSRAAREGTRPSLATSGASSASGRTRRWRWPLTAPTRSQGRW
jgi:hypothetical protein